MSRRRRGSTLAIVLCLYLALGSVLLGAVAIAATATSAGERDYRRSQALALAEAGVAEARAGAAAHGLQTLGDGSYAWDESITPTGRRVTARGEIRAANGALISRRVTVLFVRSGSGWSVRAWREQ